MGTNIDKGRSYAKQNHACLSHAHHVTRAQRVLSWWTEGRPPHTTGEGEYNELAFMAADWKRTSNFGIRAG